MEDTTKYLKNIDQAVDEVAQWPQAKLENAKQAFSEPMPEGLNKCSAQMCEAETVVVAHGVREGEVYDLPYCETHWNEARRG